MGYGGGALKVQEHCSCLRIRHFIRNLLKITKILTKWQLLEYRNAPPYAISGYAPAVPFRFGFDVSQNLPLV